MALASLPVNDHAQDHRTPQFPARHLRAFLLIENIARKLVRADGISIADLLSGIAPLFPFDQYDRPLLMMQAVTGDTLDPAVEADYMRVVRECHRIYRSHRHRTPRVL